MGRVNINLFPQDAVPTGSGPGITKLGTTVVYWGIPFDPAQRETMDWTCWAINYGTNSSLTLDFKWQFTGGTTGSVVWGGAIASLNNAENLGIKTFSGAFNYMTGYPTANTTSGVFDQKLELTNLNGLGSGELFFLRFGRSGNSASDVLTTDAVLVAMNLSYSD